MGDSSISQNTSEIESQSFRLIDYFSIVGYSEDKSADGRNRGIILQRFPKLDWPDEPFTDNMEIFLQPQGWALSTERKDPTFFMSAFTNVEATRRYFACLCFNEKHSPKVIRTVDEDEDILEDDLQSPQAKQFFAPKVICVTSKLNLADTFRTCLGTVYTSFIERSQCRLEVLIGQLLGQPHVPPPGGALFRFSIGGGEHQLVQPPLSPNVSVTGISVSLLAQQLGIKNLLKLFRAIITEQKILFFSKSTTRLFEALGASEALVYPFKWLHTFIPILPAALPDIVSSPTPFMIGLLSDATYSISDDLEDVVQVDLDGGSVRLPKRIPTTDFVEPSDGKGNTKGRKSDGKRSSHQLLCNSSTLLNSSWHEEDSNSLNLVPKLPQCLWREGVNLLTGFVNPELATCDLVYPPLAVKQSIPFQLDKEIRAIFLYLMAKLLQGYRSCLMIIRIHPKPAIKFNQAKFLGGRGLVDSAFTRTLMNTQTFHKFVTERGSPYRVTDIWDYIYGNFEGSDDKLLIKKQIQDIAEKLGHNECPNGHPFVPKVVRPPDWSLLSTNETQFPFLDENLVQETLSDNLNKKMYRYNSSIKVITPQKIVPVGPTSLYRLDRPNQLNVPTKRQQLEVLRNCIDDIFNNRISSASKRIHAVKKALESRTARIVLCEQLTKFAEAGSNVALLERQQFDLVVNLMQSALQATSEMDEDGVAGSLLPLSTTFCRKLCTGVIQFAYITLQDHPVWRNQSFWESIFYLDVEKALVAQHVAKRRKLSGGGNLTAMDITAQQLRLLPTLDRDKLEDYSVNDETTLFTQSLSYANRMVFLLTPLDPHNVKRKESHRIPNQYMIGDSVSNVTSTGETDSVGTEFGIDEQEAIEEGKSIISRVIGRFIEKVCQEGDVSGSYVTKLNQMIPEIVEMQQNYADGVRRELKRLPPIPKPEIPMPNLLPGEKLVMDSIRVLLVSDGREVGECVGGVEGEAPTNLNKSPIPAEGALLMTNYRLIFKGYPCDQTVSAQVIIRSCPISSIVKEKRFTMSEFGKSNCEGTIIRSAIFQLMKVVFDEDVQGEVIEGFRKALQRLRYPADIFGTFAFVGHKGVPASPFLVGKDNKHTIFRGVTKTARKVLVKPKTTKKQKYVLRSWGQGGGGTLPPDTKYGVPPMSSQGDDLSLDSVSSFSEVSDDESSGTSHTATLLANPASDSKMIDKMLERSYVQDWKRVGLGTTSRTAASAAVNLLNKAETIRFTYANSGYGLCISYPAILAVPQSVNDESLRTLSHGYNCCRIPVVTWRHSVTRALLLRGASLNSKGLSLRVFGGQKGPGGTSDALHFEQESYVRAVVNATPGTGRHDLILGICESNWSLDSILPPTTSQDPSTMGTPDSNRKGPLHKGYGLFDTLRTSGGKGLTSYKSWTAKRPKKAQVPQLFNMTSVGILPSEHIMVEPMEPHGRRILYIFMEKSKLKSLKSDTGSKVEYIPVSLDLGKLRTSFKEVLRCSIPSNPFKPGESFWKAFERSDWLGLLQKLMRYAGAIVDLMDIQGSSVMICLGDGGDFTAQLSSLTQICLDPYYRTLDGFTTLIEKEWLAFGHKFSERNNMTGAEGYKSKEGITPVFLQFLDAVHQIMLQYPTAFEYSAKYIKFLAYHSLSARFRTFLVDSECQRVTFGFQSLDEKRGSLPRQYRGVIEIGSDDESYLTKNGNATLSPNSSSNLGQSVFDYITKWNNRLPIFYNFKYDKTSDVKTLKPWYDLCQLLPWDFFFEEALTISSPYDLELSMPEESGLEEFRAADLTHSGAVHNREPRKVVNATMDLHDREIPDVYSSLLEETRQQEVSLSLLPQNWKARMEKMEMPSTIHSSRSSAAKSQSFRKCNELAHRKSTASILLQGKMLKSHDLIPAATHHFDKKAMTDWVVCGVCSTTLLARVCLQCQYCRIAVHERCCDFVQRCSGFSDGGGIQAEIMSGNMEPTTLGPVDAVPMKTSENMYNHYPVPSREDCTFEGYLLKRGALLKGWKKRWFVLDSTKHELRYYETHDDTQCKGFIDLSEVKRVGHSDSQSGANDKSNDPCLFEVRTTKRVYQFISDKSETTTEWIERINMCLI